MNQLFDNFEEEIKKYGLDIPTYEKICRDIDDKQERTIDLDWGEICSKYNVQCASDTMRKASSGIFGGYFRTQYLKNQIYTIQMIFQEKKNWIRNYKIFVKNAQNFKQLT